MPKCQHKDGCDATERSSGGLINLGAYTSSQDAWYCPKHMPADWVGHPTFRMPVQDMFAMYKFVSENRAELERKPAPKQKSND
jgi:hypothetical protein